jgi:7-cyano-7-deazaguanine synthase
MKLSKKEIIRLALRLNAPLAHTWSCYAGGLRPCGRCDSCKLRAKGFEAAGLPDPAMSI